MLHLQNSEDRIKQTYVSFLASHGYGDHEAATPVTRVDQHGMLATFSRPLLHQPQPREDSQPRSLSLPETNGSAPSEFPLPSRVLETSWPAWEPNPPVLPARRCLMTGP